MNVFITMDTEIWCNGWDDLDAKFPEYFRKYVYGSTPKGDYALPGNLAILEAYGLQGVFFVEPLFSARFGLEPLQEMVGLLLDKNQELQLHLHPEWVDEVGDQLLSGITAKNPHLFNYSLEQQTQLMAWGIDRLGQAGATDINAFRAGSFSANRDTLRAAAANGLQFDSSYNLGSLEGVKDIAPGEKLIQPSFIDGLHEYPVSVVRNPGQQSYRILQVTACSYREFVSYLNQAEGAGWDSVVIVTHNFELLSADKTRVDSLVLRRFEKICRYLSQHPQRFTVRGFKGLTPVNVANQPEVIEGNRIQANLRKAEQAIRNLRYH